MGPIRDATEACQALEATLLRQMIRESGVFKGGGTPGGQIHADMFVDALADAVENAGGIGVAALVQKSLPREADVDAENLNESGGANNNSEAVLNDERNRVELLIGPNRRAAKGDWP